MKISFENADKVNGQLTIVVEEADYNEKVEKTHYEIGRASCRERV